MKEYVQQYQIVTNTQRRVKTLMFTLVLQHQLNYASDVTKRYH